MSDMWVLVIVALPLIGLLAGAVMEVARRDDLARLRKAMWLGALLLIPIFGLAFYIVVRPPRAEQVGVDADASNAEAVVLLAERRQRGDLTDTEFHSEVAAIVSVD